MHAAASDSDACVQLLLPVSDVLAKDEHGSTASMWARREGCKSLAQLIDAYALSQTERAAIEVVLSPGSVRGKSTSRI